MEGIESKLSGPRTYGSRPSARNIELMHSQLEVEEQALWLLEPGCYKLAVAMGFETAHG